VQTISVLSAMTMQMQMTIISCSADDVSNVSADAVIVSIMLSLLLSLMSLSILMLTMLAMLVRFMLLLLLLLLLVCDVSYLKQAGSALSLSAISDV
jgi:hypothetical protein